MLADQDGRPFPDHLREGHRSNGAGRRGVSVLQERRRRREVRVFRCHIRQREGFQVSREGLRGTRRIGGDLLHVFI